MTGYLLALTLAVAGAADTSNAPGVAAQAPAPQQSFLDQTTPNEVQPPRSAARAIGMALVLSAMVVGGVVAWNRANNGRRPLVSGDKINLLAYKALGGKQRLALVEVCGERLLLSANDQEVTLLSHLPGAPEAMEAETEMADVPPVVAQKPQARSDVPRGQTVAAMEQALAQTPEPASDFSSDLAGLHRWQQRAQTERRA